MNPLPLRVPYEKIWLKRIRKFHRDKGKTIRHPSRIRKYRLPRRNFSRPRRQGLAEEIQADIAIYVRSQILRCVIRSLFGVNQSVHGVEIRFVPAGNHRFYGRERRDAGSFFRSWGGLEPTMFLTRKLIGRFDYEHPPHVLREGRFPWGKQ